MFFKNKNEKLLSEAIDSNYAVIYFKPDSTIIKANQIFLKTMGYSLAGDCRETPLYFL